jgi:hypothetical protein
MKPKLLTNGVWSRLTNLAEKTPAFCAVPYFGTGASKLLPLRPGSRLVLKFDRGSVQSGQVNPKEVIRLIKDGVEVHACANLHAKVFVFGDITILGSANVSASSANHLVEACIEFRSRTFSSACKQFVVSVSGDIVGLEFAKKMVELYRPPQFKSLQPKSQLDKAKRVVPQHSDLWLVALVERDWTEKDDEEEEAGWSKAERALTNPKKSEVETFLWTGGRLLDLLKIGDRVLMNTKIDKEKSLISPPGRVLNIRRYRSGKKRRGIIFLEVASGKHRKNQRSLVKSLGPLEKSLGNPRRTKRLSNSELIFRLGQAFV